MTIYSQHPHRGKTQILATFRAEEGMVSTTVTSVDSPSLATPIVDALNRVSACATVPLSVWDQRGRGFEHYPSGHLAALTDRSALPTPTAGAHSLWYEHAMMLLQHALADLDTAVAAAPPPVKTAIAAELATEARGLRDELAEYREGVEPADSEVRRLWTFGSPVVVVDESVGWLDPRERANLDGLEDGLSKAELEIGVADLRLLVEAHRRCGNHQARLLMDAFEITDDPDTDEDKNYFLNVQAPIPNGKWHRTRWNVEICRWVPDGPQTEDESGAVGEPVLDCARHEPPALAEIISLLNRSNGQADVLAVWAKTPVGEALAGTSFVVTGRHDI